MLAAFSAIRYGPLLSSFRATSLRNVARPNHGHSTCWVRCRMLTASETENINVSHSRFLSEASPRESWIDGNKTDREDGQAADINSEEDELVPDGKGKLSPTSSHLFKLILPLHFSKDTDDPHTAFLLHPSQPLSHVSRLILSSLPPSLLSTYPNAGVSFKSTTPRGHHFRWSESTDVGNFIRDAARSAEFQIQVRLEHETARPRDRDRECRSETTSSSSPDRDIGSQTETKADTFVIPVTVPTFASRTRFLRRRLAVIEGELGSMETLKKQCDAEAHRGAKRMAVTGLGVLVVYWGTVARLTFWDYGWDVMEPITYLSGLSTVILGYLWFLYQGREVSYSSVLSRSISARQRALYGSRGLDIERWQELTEERRRLRREIDRIRGEYTSNVDEKEGEKEKSEKRKDD